MHRKELVAGNLGDHIAARALTHLTSSFSLTFLRPGFHESAERIGDDAVEFSDLEETYAVKDSMSMTTIFREITCALPLVCQINIEVDEAKLNLPDCLHLARRAKANDHPCFLGVTRADPSNF
jgi:hypothetical protein